MRRDILPAAASLLVFGATEASAQSLRAAQDGAADLFARNRAVAVRDRPQPAYDAVASAPAASPSFPGFSSTPPTTTTSSPPTTTRRPPQPCA